MSELLRNYDEPEPRVFDASRALKIVDEIITDVYLPFRGGIGYRTERAILPEEPHVPHQENDAEHSWHVALTGYVLWDNRHQLALKFPEDFDIDLSQRFALVHDTPEIWVGDIDAMCRDINLINGKLAEEEAGIRKMVNRYPYMRGIGTLASQYVLKDSYEAKYNSDVDKIVGVRMICADGGRRWQNWEGMKTSRRYMSDTTRAKLLTPMGHALFDEVEKDLDDHPEYFPPSCSYQDTLF